MAILDGCHVITAQNVTDGTATITTGHVSVGGEATCQTIKPKRGLWTSIPALIAKPNPNRSTLRVLFPVTAVSGNLRVPVVDLNAGDRICWLSTDA